MYGSDEGVQVARNVEYDPEPLSLTHKFWHASLQVQKRTDHLQHLAVDFSGKAGKKRLQYTAIYDAKKRTIDWDDTNTWKQLYYHDKQLLAHTPKRAVDKKESLCLSFFPSMYDHL